MPRHWRDRVAVILAIVLVASVVPSSVAAADPTPTPDGLPGIPPLTDPTTEPSPTPSSEPSADPATDPGADPVDGSSPDPAGDPGVQPAALADSGRFIVLLAGDANVSKALKRLEGKAAFKADRTFKHALKGFSATLDKSQRKKLAADPAVAAIMPDERIELAAQVIPTGVSRVNGRLSDIASIDGNDERVDADVAIVDTGIALHPDLNVVGGINCSTSDPTAWRDVQSHGTHVAGIVGALDNDIGVVGVAPGARLWAVKILNDSGFGFISWYVCGLDWILAQRDPDDASRPLFEAVNMSVGKPGEDDHNCGWSIPSAMHRAVCRVVAGGIPIAVAAMNESKPAARFEPASYNEVITVSALADTDGLPGGYGGAACYSWGGYDNDDTFANFSNYGADVDLIAPGKCIRSTVPGGYGTMSGTSMATPTVVGAIALYRSRHPNATPSDVRTVLRGLGNQGWKTGTDPDNTHEPLLDVRRIDGLGDFDIDLPGGTLALDESGGPIPITISRTPEAFEPLVFSVGGLPSGASATVTPSTAGGFDAKTATLKVNLPSTVPGGTFHLTVTGTIQGRSRSDVVAVTFTDQAPVMGSVKIAIGKSPRPTSSSAPIRVSWPTATEPSGVIAAYEVERSVDGGTWSKVATLGGTSRSFQTAGSTGHSYTFRVRAIDGRGLIGARVASSALAPRVLSESNPAVRYSGAWSRHSSASAIGGSTRSTTAKGASATLTFSGRQVAWVGPRGPGRGKVKVYIDGVYVTTVSQWARTFSSRRVLFARTFAIGGTHTLRLVNKATDGHPRMVIDAFIVSP
ncbi:MAG: S8 family serine peptidase [Candidatus Limnocylindrales bacterium]